MTKLLSTHDPNKRIVQQHIACPSCPSSDAKRNKYLRNKRWIEKHKDAVRLMWRTYAKKWRKSNLALSLLISARSRSKKKNIPFDIELADIPEIPATCPVLNTALTSPSLDRINNDQGYVKGNVRIISKKANRLKSNMTLEECQLILKDLEKTQIIQ